MLVAENCNPQGAQPTSCTAVLSYSFHEVVLLGSRRNSSSPNDPPLRVDEQSIHPLLTRGLPQDVEHLCLA